MTSKLDKYWDFASRISYQSRIWTQIARQSIDVNENGTDSSKADPF